MEDEVVSLIRKINFKLHECVDYNMIEALALLEDYIRHYSYRDDLLEELDSSNIKVIISKYFRDLETNFVEEFMDFFKTKLNSLEESLEEKKDTSLIDEVMSRVDFENQAKEIMNREINKGLNQFDSTFESDFKSNFLLDFRYRTRSDFDIALSAFFRQLGIKLEEVMNETVKLLTVKYVAKQIENFFEKYKSMYEYFNSSEKNSRLLEELDDIYNSYSDAIENSEEVKHSYDEIKGYIKLLDSQKVDLDNMTQKQLDRFNNLKQNLAYQAKIYYLGTHKNVEKPNPLKKFVSVNNQKGKELPQDEDKKMDESINLVPDLSYNEEERHL